MGSWAACSAGSAGVQQDFSALFFIDMILGLLPFTYMCDLNFLCPLAALFHPHKPPCLPHAAQ